MAPIPSRRKTRNKPLASKRKKLRRPHLKQERESPPRRPYPQHKSQAEVAAENQTRRGEQVNVIMREGYVFIYSFGKG
jgi:hypothetical protein